MVATILNHISILLFLITCLSAASARRVGASVRTSSGLIVGHAAPNRSEVSEYLGIPYASPPTGQRRFAPPLEYKSNETVLASSYSLDCPSNIAPAPEYPGLTPQAPKIIEFLTGQSSTPQGEDCLYLNVWTRPTSKLKPVLVAVHGGRYETGSVNNALYDGQELVAEHDAVVVTLNYRVDIFGFPGAPGLSQNIGLLDQRMAIEWIHHNIAGFGGDPKRITIFGQSAGASSVDFYSYAWAQDPIVSGLISHSGTALSLVPNTPDESCGRFYNVSRALGCGDSSNDTQHVVECVRRKPWKDLMDASSNLPLIPSATIPQAPFHPTVDGKIIFDNYTQRSAAGEFARLPYLVTSNYNEANFYKIGAHGYNLSLSQETWDNFTLAAFTCPSTATVKDRAAHGVPAWQSRYFHYWDNLGLYPESGAYHASELPMVLGTAERMTGIPSSRQQKKLSRYMASAWVAFASDPHNGLTQFGWPQYNPLESTLVGLGYKKEASAQFLSPAEIDPGCVAWNGDITFGYGAI